MIKKIKNYLLTFSALLTLLVPAAVPITVHAAEAEIEESLCSGAELEFTSNPNCSNTSNAEQSVNDILAMVINIFSVVVGIIAVVMIIVGGIRFVLSGGDSAATSAARNTIIFAIVGLVVVALAQIIVRYVLNRVSSTV